YAMDVIVQPPSTVRLGIVLQPPVTVRLRSPPGDPASDADIAETTNLLAVATLTADSINDSTNPGDLSALLAGRRFDSIHPYPEDDEGPADARGVGYVSFPDLVIRQEGTYRIRVTLIRIRASVSGESVAAAGGSSVQVVESETVTVER
ncbi:hypothetical protein K432DRAFT_256646, partial [Lepidopterella palustris CBS 459.81]